VLGLLRCVALAVRLTGSVTHSRRHAAAFTNNLRDAWRYVDGLQHGTVLINEATNYWDQLAPFGGAKSSGVGRELSTDTLEAFTQKKTIAFIIS
jgi:succinate-semialdehyde dehydrogenase/glutarate-semialdehyde dehydrogenase